MVKLENYKQEKSRRKNNSLEMQEGIYKDRFLDIDIDGHAGTHIDI